MDYFAGLDVSVKETSVLWMTRARSFGNSRSASVGQRAERMPSGDFRRSNAGHHATTAIWGAASGTAAG